jgi:hypothetical protein
MQIVALVLRGKGKDGTLICEPNFLDSCFYSQAGKTALSSSIVSSLTVTLRRGRYGAIYTESSDCINNCPETAFFSSEPRWYESITAPSICIELTIFQGSILDMMDDSTSPACWWTEDVILEEASKALHAGDICLPGTTNDVDSSGQVAERIAVRYLRSGECMNHPGLSI